jgi:hypothetical protein
LLLAVEHVVVAVAPGGRLERRSVRADPRFGQPERRELLAARLRDEPTLFYVKDMYGLKVLHTPKLAQIERSLKNVLEQKA